MRNLFLVASVSLIFCGCALFPGSKQSSAEFDADAAPLPVVRLADSISGRVSMANPNFVVLTFSFGGVPAAGQILNVYRDGKRVAQLKVTGPRRNLNTVADVISGQAQLNDEVRND